ncbi:hypothetical protein [uncultured Psychroserpens sp.]|uniref:hypothetical protein n=1 Tax=uncultured Psychroserpens sp. TaxID=255436 RepID=UPI0026196FA2|nr:hypothetical protein [uncultured Psychroserpens sp.]
MKNIFKISFALSLMMLTFSCDETVDQVIYNGVASENRTFLSFTASVYNLPVTIDDTGQLDITLNSSTATSSDRTFNVVLNTDPELTTADPNTYTLPATVTIPANSYQGTLTITGADNGLVDATVKQIVFSLDGLPSSVDMDSNQITVNVFEVCPVPDTFFVGQYNLVDSNGNFPSEEVTVSVGATSTDRVFTSTFLPGTGVDTVLPVNISLACNLFNLTPDIDITVSCTGGAPPYYILTSAGASNSSYSLASDTVHVVNYTEDPNASCGGTSIQNFTLTKI